MWLEGFGLSPVILTTILEPDLESCMIRTTVSDDASCLCSRSYLHFLLSQRDATHNIGARCLVWFGIALIFGFEYRVVLGTKRQQSGSG